MCAKSKIISLFLLLTCKMASGQLKFDKDDGMDTRFPPTITKQIYEEIPVGHLLSLGHQRYAEGPLMEVNKAPLPLEFFKEYIDKSEPVVVRKTIDKDAPIMTSWSDEKLKNSHGNLEVLTYRRHETVDGVPKKLSFERFLNTYKLEDIYMATTIPHDVVEEIPLPSFLQCGPASRSLIEAELWMAFGGAGSLLHYHGEHQVHCAVDGRKDFILIEHKYKKDLKCVEKHPFTGEGYSTIDTEVINMFKDRQMALIPWTYATIHSGDCLYIPAGYIHHVRSYGRSLSYSIQFAPTLDRDESDCRKTQITFRPLSVFDFMWTAKNGIEQLANENLTPKLLRHHLELLMRNENVLPFERFEYYYNTAVQKAKRKLADARVIFRNLDPKGEGLLTDKQIKNLKEDHLIKVIRILNSVHYRRHDEL